MVDSNALHASSWSQAGIDRIRSNLASRVKKGRMSEGAAASALGRVTGTLEYGPFKSADMVIEVGVGAGFAALDELQRLLESCLHLADRRAAAGGPGRSLQLSLAKVSPVAPPSHPVAGWSRSAACGPVASSPQ